MAQWHRERERESGERDGDEGCHKVSDIDVDEIKVPCFPFPPEYPGLVHGSEGFSLSDGGRCTLRAEIPPK
ncbi:Vesicular glutamate transporter 2, partial [Dissostichus eleginoides]